MSMDMDRESKAVKITFPEGNSGESDGISTARYAWQSLHFPAELAAGTLSYEVFNVQTESYVAAVDGEGSPIAAVPVAAGGVVPVNINVNYGRVWRVKMSGAQPDNLEFTVINKT